MGSKVVGTIVSISILVAAGCGGSITEPAAAPKTSQTSAPTVPEGPPPTPPPTPTPSPTPAPTPGPGGPPGPAPAVADYYDAEVGTVFWHSTPLFGNRFTIEVWTGRGELWLHNTRLWIVQKDADSIMASDRDPATGGGSHTLMAMLNLKTRQWSFNGVAGSGAGTLTFRETR